jgi:hypothetical protein
MSLDAVEATVVHVHFVVSQHVLILVEFGEFVLQGVRHAHHMHVVPRALHRETERETVSDKGGN